MAIDSVSGSGTPYQGGQAVPESSAVGKGISESGTFVRLKEGNVRADSEVEKTASVNEKGLETDDEETMRDSREQLNVQSNQIRKAVDDINKRASNSEAVFGIHDATNRVTIKIIDKDSKKVLKEYPPEKTLDMIAKVWEMAGLMVDEKR